MNLKHTFLIICSCFLLNISCISKKKLSSPISYSAEIDNFREHKKQEFRVSDRAPIKGKEIELMRFFDVNPDFKVIADVELLPEGESISIKTSSGDERPYIPYAKLTFELDSKPYSLTVHTSRSFASVPKYKDLLFLMFYDNTNGEETYGGGRYIDLSKKDIVNNTLEIDFNKCYHPYCHYSSGYSCPIPPQDNFIDLKVTAGEKNYAGTYKGEH